LGIIIWLVGMIGVVSMLFILPSLLGSHPSKLPVSVLLCLQLLQSGILLMFAVWVGTTLASKMELSSPGMEALAYDNSFSAALRPQILPGLSGGIVIGLLLVCMSFIIPSELRSSSIANINPMLKILTEVLYGGITEEILLRWGMMTFLLWLLCRLFQRNQNKPSSFLMWMAIIGSALLFALGHLPAAHLLAGHLTAPIVVYVMTGNVLAGVVFGFLYKRFGLESAMIAHAGAHLLADVMIYFIRSI
jgi:membrane protease YdiL (CAAX protease family)